MKGRGENFLKNLRAPPPDPEARVHAKRGALAEFARTHSSQAAANSDIKLPAFQALWRRLRLSREQTSHGSASMKGFNNRGLFAAAAGLGVLAIGLSWVLPNVERYQEELTQPEVVASGPELDASPPAAHAPAPAEQAVPQAEAPRAEASAASREADKPKSPAKAAATATATATSASAASATAPAAATTASAKSADDLARQDGREAFEAREKSELQSTAQAQISGDAIGQESAGRMVSAVATPQPLVLTPQAPPPLPDSAAGSETEEIVVTGSRRTLRASRESKRAPVAANERLKASGIANMPGNAPQAGYYQV